MITTDLVILSRFLSEIDGTALDSLEGRIAFQKRIYLLQAGGVDLGYRFEWDVYGPYSRGLASSGTRYDEEREHIDSMAATLQLTGEAKQVVERVRSAMQKPQAAFKLTDTAWLELLCSLDFISKTLKVNLSDADRLASELTRRKPFFSAYRDQIGAALGGLRQLAGA